MVAALPAFEMVRDWVLGNGTLPKLGVVERRKADDGFGEGNFKALFQSIERDQIKRGVLATGQA